MTLNLLCQQIVFQILVRGLIGLEPGPEMQQLKEQFQEFIVGLMSLPIKLPGTRLYRSLQVRTTPALTCTDALSYVCIISG
jgi:hypothetical protein